MGEFTYVGAERVFEALERTVDGLHLVRLLRMSWLLKQRGIPLQRRQELPEEAFLGAGELRHGWERSWMRDEVLPIIVVSSRWDSPSHPDPHARQLNKVIDALERNKHTYTMNFHGSEGFSEVGIFWDWACLLHGDGHMRQHEAHIAAAAAAFGGDRSRGGAPIQVEERKGLRSRAAHTTSTNEERQPELVVTEYQEELSSGGLKATDELHAMARLTQRPAPLATHGSHSA